MDVHNDDDGDICSVAITIRGAVTDEWWGDAVNMSM